MPSVELDRNEFERRFRQRHQDPLFDDADDALRTVIDAAWQSYSGNHKAPRTRKAGPEFADPNYDLSIDWLAARDAIRSAETQNRNAALPAKILVINGSARTNQSCPGETSKSYRLAKLAQGAIEGSGAEVDFLDMSVLVSEYGRVIYPCKSCVSTAQPLCHWPCSCYPNHGLGQTQDWMNELYPRWVAAHGVMIITPVNWYHVPSVLKLMIDRLVCADGGNPDPTSTHGKNAAKAKAIELEGWDYPKHLAGRAFAVVVHGDVAGVGEVKNALCDWLEWMGLISAGPAAAIDRFIGYYEPYATSHDALDRDEAVQIETQHAALALVERVKQIRSGRYEPADKRLVPPRKK
ncbi:MAG TPA: flavodoxin family protein [Gammaproteobacteria bacterium]|nr:flavodoxin family protein [Gammaproteobacteria bacterium]